MTDLTLAQAQAIATQSLAVARERGFKPMAVVVLDARGSLKAAASEDGCPIVRWKVAFGKANVCVNFGAGGRRVDSIARERPHFFAGLESVIGDGGAVPVPGGVLIRDADGRLLGGCGMSGDTSDNDEAALVAAITAAGLVADCG
ncbi:MAG: heme-binding protein [Hyphomicrobiales bacterium]|nr:heme-binding protein [Hyphomicrobiales bacterium]